MHLAGKFLSCLHHLAAEIEPAVLKFAPDEFSVRDTVLYHQHRQLLAFGVELLRFGLNYQFARNHELCPAARAVLPATGAWFVMSQYSPSCLIVLRNCSKSTGFWM